MSEEPVVQIVNETQFAALFRECEQKRIRSQSINGEVGERIKHAVEDGHLHRKLFNLMRALSRMDELKRNDFLSQFPIYVEMCERAGFFGDQHVGDLAELAERKAEEEAEAKEAADAAHVARNEALLEKGISEISPEDSAVQKKSRAKVVGFPGSEGKAALN